jgi:hypothetical protein
MTDKWNARLAAMQARKNDELQRKIARIDRIQTAVILFMAAVILTAFLIVFWMAIQ